jgi:Glycine rich protein
MPLSTIRFPAEGVGPYGLTWDRGSTTGEMSGIFLPGSRQGQMFGATSSIISATATASLRIWRLTNPNASGKTVFVQRVRVFHWAVAAAATVVSFELAKTTDAPGGVGFHGGPAGLGARVSADLAVIPGQTLYVNVGGTPTGGARCYQGVACQGGFNGGGSSDFGGGGASDVRFVPRDQNNTLFSRLSVAAGGGGSGGGVERPRLGSGSCDRPEVPLLGGFGGDAGSDGGAGHTNQPDPEGRCVLLRGTEGRAGTQTAGGAGGGRFAESGSLGQGGGDPNGGGGLFAGGAGEGPITPQQREGMSAGGGAVAPTCSSVAAPPPSSDSAARR